MVFGTLGTISKVPQLFPGAINLTEISLFGNKSEHFDRVVLKMMFIKPFRCCCLF